MCVCVGGGEGSEGGWCGTGACPTHHTTPHHPHPTNPTHPPTWEGLKVLLLAVPGAAVVADEVGEARADGGVGVRGEQLAVRPHVDPGALGLLQDLHQVLWMGLRRRRGGGGVG